MFIMIARNSITTAEQLLAAGDIGRCELVRGELIMMSLVGPNHGNIANRIAFYLTRHVLAEDIGSVYAAETGFMIARDPDTVRAPDVAFVRKDRLHLTPKRGYFPGAPDLAAEVLSPDDTASEVLAKVEEWLNAGTEEVWVADPERKTIAVYRKDQPVHVLSEKDELTSESLLPGFQLAVAEVFG